MRYPIGLKSSKMRNWEVATCQNNFWAPDLHGSVRLQDCLPAQAYIFYMGTDLVQHI